MTKCKQYDMEYKVQAVKLAHKIGGQRVVEAGYTEKNLRRWMRKERKGVINFGLGSRNPDPRPEPPAKAQSQQPDEGGSCSPEVG